MALIKSSADIILLRKAGKILGRVLVSASAAATPGTTLLVLDAQIDKEIRAAGATPSFLGFEGFPNSSCLSVNSQVVHGIPSSYALKQGDILGIDVGLWYEGICVDAAVTVASGGSPGIEEKLLAPTRAALSAGIKAVKPFRRVGAIGEAVQAVAEKHELGIVRSLTGHGVGHHIHEDPEVPNYGSSSMGIALKPGMVLAIEPMLTLGSGAVETEADGWGVVTSDGSLAAQFEHTILVTQKGAEILTLP